MAGEVLTVFTTWPDLEAARTAARTLVEERLAACGNIVPGVESIYRWKGRVDAAAEFLMIIKSSRERFSALEERVKALHSYDIPEIIALLIEKGSREYLAWLTDSVRQKK